MSESGETFWAKVRSQPHLLLHARGADLFPIFLGVFGLIVLVSLAVTRCSSWMEQKERSRQQTLQEQQYREAQEEAQRQAARREGAVWAGEAQRQQEAEARRRLEQEGVRSVALPSSTPELPRAVGVSLVVRSDPAQAEVFLDWISRGYTPLRLEGIQIAGLLVLVKDGYQSWFRDVNYREHADLPVDLPSEEAHPRLCLLLVSDDASGEAFASLSTHLIEEGFTVVGTQEAGEFQRMASRAGGLSHAGLRAWARAKFNTALLVTARVHQSIRELDQQSAGHAGISEALKGAVRAEVRMELTVHDLDSGHHLTAMSGQGADFGLDRLQSIQKALAHAAREVAQKLRIWRQG